MEKKVIDPEKQDAFCSYLKLEMLHPLRVTIANRGPDAELLVANPVELSGKGRPRVFYDVTFALKKLGICVFLVRKFSNMMKQIFNVLDPTEIPNSFNMDIEYIRRQNL